jgi:hypothetical protein
VPIEDVAGALKDLIRQGKVKYFEPAWTGYITRWSVSIAWRSSRPTAGRIGSSLTWRRGCIRSVRAPLRWCSFLKAWSGCAQLHQGTGVGIISSVQNDLIKVLTIASVVGIPPVLVAGITA